MSPAAPRRLRILVAADASAHSLAAISAAVDLARGDDGDVQGLFIEDDNLLRLVALPFAWAVSRYSGHRVPLSTGSVLAEMAAQAQAARQALALAAAANAVHWRFRTLRGPWPGTLFHAAADVDLVTVGRAGRQRPGQPGVGVLFGALIHYAPTSTLIVGQGQRPSGPVAVLDAGTPLSAAAERLAAELAARLGGAPEILQLPQPAGSLPTGAAATTPPPIHPAAQALDRLLTDARPGLMVLPADWPGLTNGGLAAILDWLPCPLVLAR